MLEVVEVGEGPLWFQHFVKDDNGRDRKRVGFREPKIHLDYDREKNENRVRARVENYQS
jgi:hypothetical protein